MRRAKIVCTLGPATDPPGVLEALVRAGMEVARFNFSHGTQEAQARRIRAVRAVSRRLARPVAVLQDLQGPKIRVGLLKGGALDLTAGDEVVLTPRAELGRAGRIPVSVRTLARDVAPGDPVLLDDGRIRLRARKVERAEVRCQVEVGGTLRDRKGVNVPAAAVSVPSLTRKDLGDLDFGLKAGVDFVALSFVRTGRDLEHLRARMGDHPARVIAKIEKPQAVEHLGEIISACDGIMVARGDLGVELALEKLPYIQKQAIAEAHRRGRVTIVATEMLESMVRSERPTRAEVSDVANAIFDGADAVMLSAETAVGAHPVEAVATMARIVEEAERSGEVRHHRAYEDETEISIGVAAAAVTAAHQLRAALLVAYTESGDTAKRIAELRPACRILALTPNPRALGRMALLWGVEPRRVRSLSSTEAMVRQVRRLCRSEGLAEPGAPVVIVTGVPLNQRGGTNLMTVHRV